jgi:hypothetical protein
MDGMLGSLIDQVGKLDEKNKKKESSSFKRGGMASKLKSLVQS